MKLSEKIVFLRKRNGMSQEELANELGVSRQAIYKWENDITSPEIEKIRVLSELFSVTFDDLLNDNIDLSNPSVISTNTDDSISEVAPATIPPKKPRLPLIISLCVVALCTIVVFIVGISLIVSSLNKEHTHDFGEYIEVAEPSCTKAGAQKRVCKSCGEEETKPIPMVPHSKITIERKEPTCVSVGFTEWEKCSICQTVLKEAVEIAIIPTNHIEQEIKGTAPTCTKTGLTGGVKCQLCDTILKEQTVIPISKDNHISETIKGYDATCVEDGLTDGIKCSECNSILQAQERIPAKGHTDVVVQGCAPTCISVGYKDGLQCSVCGTITLELEEIPIDPNAHEIEILSRVEPTCLTDGLTEGEKCSICKKTLTPQVVIPSNGTHTPVTLEGIEATCTENGLTEGKKCSVCEEILVEQEEILATGHTEITLTGKEATCTEDGLTEGKKCSVCDEILVEQEEILATGHTEITLAGKEATCTEDGLTEGKTCSVCGEAIIAQEILPIKLHIIENDECTLCGLSADPSLFTFTLNDDGQSYTVSFEEGSAPISDIIVPSKYGEYPVTGVGRFYGSTSPKRIFLPDTITTIGDYAFWVTTISVDYVNIPSGVTSIGTNAFAGANLETIIVPKGATVSDGAFGSSSLKSIIYEEGTTKINPMAVSNSYTPLKHEFSIYIPYTVTTIEGPVLASVPDGDYVTVYCENGADTSTWAENWNKFYGDNPIGWHDYNVIWVDSVAVSNFIFELDEDNASYSVKGVKGIEGEVKIPPTYNGLPVTNILTDGFRQMSGITALYLPSSIKTISDGAFFECSNLSSITFNEGLEKISQYAFSGTAITEVHIPSGVTHLGKEAFAFCRSLKAAYVPNTVITMESTVFWECSLLEAIYCENGANLQEWWHRWDDLNWNNGYDNPTKHNVVWIGEGENIHSFRFVLNEDNASYSVGGQICFDKVVIPSTYKGLPVTAILIEGFKGQDKMTEVYIPGSVKTIEMNAFSSCTSLTKVVLEEGVESLGTCVFEYCDNIDSIYISKTVTQIDSPLIITNTLDIGTTLYCQRGADTSNWASHNGVEYWDKYMYAPALELSDLYKDLGVVWVDACPEDLLQ